MPASNDDDLLSQLQADSAQLGLSDDDVVASLNYEAPPNPLDNVDYTDDIEEDSKRELSAIEQGFKDRAHRERKRFDLAVDTEYWFCLCFKTRAEKEQFLAATGLDAIADKYLDGHAAARIMGIELEGGDE